MRHRPAEAGEAGDPLSSETRATAAESPESPPPESQSPEASVVERALKRLRDNIDQVDSVLVKLLNQRARWALEIGDVKKGADIAIYQPDREKKVLDGVQSQNRGPLGEAAMQRLFERIIDESRRLERIGGDGDDEGGGA